MVEKGSDFNSGRALIELQMLNSSNCGGCVVFSIPAIVRYRTDLQHLCNILLIQLESSIFWIRA